MNYQRRLLSLIVVAIGTVIIVPDTHPTRVPDWRPSN
jgi:hypothetical protein